MASSCPKDARLPVEDFTPSMWVDFFTSFSLDNEVQEKYGEAIEVLKYEARSMLTAEENTTANKLVLIDTLERLGVAYHFEQEIEDQLQQIFFQFHQEENYDLFTTALQFRLLRQHRHNVSSDIFYKFKRKLENKFKETLTSDAKGLLSLYEAAHVRIHGEDILEEAVAFTTHHLNRMVEQLESPLEDQVKRALEQPLHRGIPRIETRHFISFYEKDGSKNELLLKLAKLDFNYLQNMYKKELSELSRWWNKLDLKSELPYTRDRVVECYLWGIIFHFEPQYSYVRVAIAKVVQLSLIIDDIYDNYATVEEADLFTEILQRWDINETDKLPDYMKIVYQFILTTYDDYERDAVKQGKSFAVPYAKETVKQLGRAYKKELKWFMGHVQMPTFEEYLANTVVTSCLQMFLTALIPSMKSSSQETIDWLMSDPNILIAVSNIFRHMNNLATYERENKRYAVTMVDIYMKQHGVSIQETLDKFVELVEDAWKDANEEWITKTCMAKCIEQHMLNYGRGAYVAYMKRRDGCTNPERTLAAHIIALFVHPMII